MNEQLYRELHIAFQVRRCGNVIEWNGKSPKMLKGHLLGQRGSAGMSHSVNTFSRHACAYGLVMARRRETGKLIGTSANTVEEVYGHHHPDYLKDATESLNF